MIDASNAPTGFERWVDCPSCGGPSRYAPDNAYRPFCCARCKQADLGAWASERFAVTAPELPDHADAPTIHFS